MKKPDGALTFEDTWCAFECPHYVPASGEYTMDMKCRVLDSELMYYDGPIAKCCEEQKEPE
jgi:hypothetical protein